MSLLRPMYSGVLSVDEGEGGEESEGSEGEGGEESEGSEGEGGEESEGSEGDGEGCNVWSSGDPVPRGTIFRALETVYHSHLH